MRFKSLLRAGATLAGVGLLFPAFANPSLLPADTVFALGLTGVDQHMEKFEPFSAEWTRLGLADSLGTLFASASNEIDEVPDIPAELDAYQDVDPLELLGRSAWLSLSMSATSPVPTLTVLLEPTGDALARVRDSLASLESDPETMSLTEGEYSFLVVNLDEDVTEGYLTAMAIGLAGDRLVLSSDPDSLRGVLRRLAGSSEPSMATTGSFAEIAPLAEGNLFSYIDYASVARTTSTLARPFAQEFGVGSLLDEAVSAMATAGVVAGSSSFTANGIDMSSVQIVGDSNATVRGLLLDRGPSSRDALAFVSEDALGVASGYSNPTGWWNYLNTLMASYPELGISSLDQLVMMFGGLDLRAGFFNWVGSELTSVTYGIAASNAPGVASDNLLGESLYILRTSADADAQAGLDTILSTLGMLVSAFTSLEGSSAGQMNTGSTEVVEGVNVRTMELTDGVVLSYAVTDGFVLVSTDATSVAAALRARADGGVASPTISRMLDQLPAGAVSYQATDTGQSLRSMASQAAAQVEMVAGLSGQGVDFDALDAASAGLEEFLNFVADHADGSWSYTTIEGNTIRTEGHAEVDWQ